MQMLDLLYQNVIDAKFSGVTTAADVISTTAVKNLHSFIVELICLHSLPSRMVARKGKDMVNYLHTSHQEHSILKQPIV